MKSDQRVVLTKRLLQEGLFHLLETRKIDEISVSALCAEAGINRATFYRHYAQPRDILREARRSLISNVQSINAAIQGEVELRSWLESLCRYFYENRKLLCILFETRSDDEFVEIISELCSGRLYSLHSKVFGTLDEASLKLTACGYAGGFFYILRQWLLEASELPPEAVAAVMHNLLTGI